MEIDQFLARWRNAGGSERANYQLFIADLCELLGVDKPQPASEDTRDNAYVFERRVVFHHGDGSTSNGFIDCYRRAALIGEVKKIRAGFETRVFDDAMLRARGQAENYARNLPPDEGRPPFLVVIDVGNVIELYAEFTCTGGSYTPFPDPRSHRIKLDDLAKPEIRARLKAVWDHPHSLDPSRRTARATREIAVRLARVAQSLEGKYVPERVAAFLSRCLFSMFAEDVGLLPKIDGDGAFTALLKSFLLPSPAGKGAGSEGSAARQFVPLVAELWKAMDEGQFSVAIRAQLPRFNGKLFKNPEVLPVDRNQLELLLAAAKADWSEVEPAIFGTLLESALNPLERHDLGAHYTPRAYVDRLVLPTVIEPLRADWHDTQAAALLLANEGKLSQAADLVRTWHHKLCTTRVLDPACGSGNFLYVTLEHMKRLEGEVLDTLAQLGDTQQRLEVEGLSVDPHQFLGLEINPRAAAIAEMVLWIGYLQWHFRTQGSGLPPSPILKDFRNIECRDAVLAHDDVVPMFDDKGVPVSRWDGRTTKKHPVTGEDVPDETARVPLMRYINPRRAEWPQADVVVGNPPFIGNKRMRTMLGDGYVEALRGAWHDVPESADFVMFWWHHAAQLVAQGRLSRFGFITTNSLPQAFNRRVVQGALDAGLHLDFAIPDHPWVDSADGAAVRIAMTVAAPGASKGRRLDVSTEREGKGEGLEVELVECVGSIHADLAIGANLAAAQSLRSNENLSNRGVIPHGAGMLVTPQDAARLEADAPLRQYRNGRDLTDRPRGVLVIDCYGLSAEEVRHRFPRLYQWLIDRVKPERDAHRDKDLREKWWLHRRNNDDLRRSLAGLPRYIATGQTAKHRVFQFLDASILPDDKLIAIALDDGFSLGVLSSHVHVCWALATGGRLGVGNDPVYNKSRCFEAFPFPATTPAQQVRIAALAEQIDALRKRVLTEHEILTLTGLYNVLEKLKAGAALTAREVTIHDLGLVAVLKSLHEELDAAVLTAYGWNDAPSDEQILDRLVALNAARAAEEAQGTIRWLRPAFQAAGSTQASIGLEAGGSGKRNLSDEATSPPPPASTTTLHAWPNNLPDQMAALAAALTAAPQTEAQLAANFTGKGRWKSRLPELLATLATLGRARRLDDGRWMG